MKTRNSNISKNEPTGDTDLYASLERKNEIGLCESLAEMRRPLQWGIESDEGIKLVGHNLELIASLLLALSKRVVKACDRAEAVELVGLNSILSYYAVVLPQVLSEQIEAVLGWLPVGLIDDCELIRCVIRDNPMDAKKSKGDQR